MGRLLQYFKGYRKEAFLGPLFKLLEAIMELFLPVLMAVLINNYIGASTHFGTVEIVLSNRQILILMPLMIIIGMVFAVTCNYFASIASTGISYKVRKAMMHKANNVSFSNINSLGILSLSNRVTNDVNQLQVAIAMFIRLVMRTPVLAIGAIIMAFIINAKLALIIVISVPLVAIFFYIIIKITVPKYKIVQERLDNTAITINDAVKGAKITRSFNREDYEIAKGKKASQNYKDKSIKVNKLSALLEPVSQFLINVGIALIVYIGAGQIDKGIINVGELSAFITYMLWLLLALTILANLGVLFSRASASIRRINQVLELDENKQENKTNTIDTSANDTAIEIKNLSFSYNGITEILDRINLKIYKGQYINIIGGTGSGKSTLVKLILGLLTPTKGDVLYYGTNYLNVNFAEVRNHITLVPQKATLFKGSIRENLTIGMDNANDNDIMLALDIAQAKSFVDKYSDGYDHLIEESASNLSGGQLQRLAIARAVIRKPKILILDDSMSELDNLTKKNLKSRLKQMGISIISVSDHIDKDSDLICLLDKGHFVATGKHEKLLRDSEQYHNIWEMQKGVQK